ncbi:MAG: methyltransferase domain-containing protein [Betaproteobacteria bacterium]|nr:MAG: methyltransferase domain-containing protein [Betaproteobacteria bacterium]
MSPRVQPDPTASTHWDPTLYLKFSDQRLRPALDLLDRVRVESPETIYDLGCGSGNATRMIAQRWPSASVYGVDSSREMLEQAAAKPGKIRWIDADIRAWSPSETADLLYSNATLHWVERHEELFPRLLGYLKPGGCLAVQMPLSWSAPSHRLMRETLANGGAGGKAIGSEQLRQSVARVWVASAEFYYDLLARSVKSVDIWQTEYLQQLEGRDPVLEWVKSTGLRPILDDFDDEERTAYLAEYGRRLRSAYPMRPDGRTLYPFRRLFIIATVY